MTGEEFEFKIKACAENLGWTVATTPKTNDFGADLIAECGDERLVVQCKCYSEDNSIGSSAVQEVYAAKAHYRAQRAAVIFRGKVTRSARTLAESTGVELFHERELQSGCKIDRTRKGAELRAAAEQKKRQEVAEREERKRNEERQDRERIIKEYRKNITAWTAKCSKWPLYKALIAVLCATCILTLLYTNDSHSTSALPFFMFWGSGLSSLFVFVTKRPGSEPIRPAFMRQDTNQRESTKSSAANASASSTIILCASCGQKLRIPQGLDLRVKCPTCKFSFVHKLGSKNING